MWGTCVCVCETVSIWQYDLSTKIILHYVLAIYGMPIYWTRVFSDGINVIDIFLAHNTAGSWINWLLDTLAFHHKNKHFIKFVWHNNKKQNRHPGKDMWTWAVQCVHLCETYLFGFGKIIRIGSKWPNFITHCHWKLDFSLKFYNPFDSIVKISFFLLRFLSIHCSYTTSYAIQTFTMT